ncbi:Cys-tRNA(Pro) deacylase [Alteromonas aestuariivivens]|uniref:Cys-tRNA(Pro)/Cys-tRNA(Cys) deacylase n=1 Tax=Alteromonas aestuariivivens TaxID=1938339 RepID=A0A3D8MBF7_9ALTE|nr:Cys-tRNA(Pro) deacylase [Alteromonas aestuariivivens]RDV27602.1 Cys-tRNA(Pro) deacylase [Alteromonas aestuariivivens]
MTPAINLLNKKKLPYQILKYVHDTSAPAYGLEAAEKLSLPVNSVFKTLVVELDGKSCAVALIPVNQKLSMKKLAKAAGSKKASMIRPEDAERITGYQVGGVSPLGQKKALPTWLHVSAQWLQRMYVSGGRRGLEIEISPPDLIGLVRGKVADLTE